MLLVARLPREVVDTQMEDVLHEPPDGVVIWPGPDNDWRPMMEDMPDLRDCESGHPSHDHAGHAVCACRPGWLDVGCRCENYHTCPWQPLWDF